MRSYMKTRLVIILFSLVYLFNAQTVYSQQGNLTIKGNIKLTKEYDRDADECCFHYKNMLSGKDVVIPIRRDSAGNFSVSMPLDTYQQIYFSKAINKEADFNIFFMIYNLICYVF